MSLGPAVAFVSARGEARMLSLRDMNAIIPSVESKVYQEKSCGNKSVYIDILDFMFWEKSQTVLIYVFKVLYRCIYTNSNHYITTSAKIR
jgi:hypothetical protein